MNYFILCGASLVTEMLARMQISAQTKIYSALNRTTEQQQQSKELLTNVPAQIAKVI